MTQIVIVEKGGNIPPDIVKDIILDHETVDMPDEDPGRQQRCRPQGYIPGFFEAVCSQASPAAGVWR
jgi:hypothetical protein